MLRNKLDYKALIAFLFFTVFQYPAVAQNKLLSLNYFAKQNYQKAFASVDSTVQTSFWPQLENQHPLDSIYGHSDKQKYYYAFTRKLFRDHLVEIKGKDYNFTFNVLFDFQLGYDFADTTTIDRKRIFNNTRGFIIQGDIGKRISFFTSVYENQSRFPLIINSYVDSLGIVPGQGRVKPNIGKDIGRDYNSSYGVLSVQAFPWLNLQFGHGKHFIGSGYRSLLISDNAYNYPYLQTSILKKKWQYHFWYSDLRVLERMPKGSVPESLFKRKSGNFYYFNYLPHPRVELGVFESVIWQEWDDIKGSLPFEGKKLIPIIGLNHLLSKNSYSRLGLNGKIKISNQMSFYSQAFWSENSKGNQFGLSYFDMMVKNLTIQLEYNTSKYTLDTLISNLRDYYHFNQSLAHPLNDEFEELVFIINYRYNRWLSQAKIITQMEGDNDRTIIDLQTSLLLNPKVNMNLTIGWIYREDLKLTQNQKTQWIYLAFRTAIGNKYYDF